jgi:hypothetical protein
MEKFEIIEHKEDKSGDGSFILKAINFVLPEYVTIVAATNIENGIAVEIDNGKAYLDKAEIGNVVKTHRGDEVKIDRRYDIKYAGGYSRDGKTLYLDRNFPETIDVVGKQISTVESIVRHHELTEKWLSDDAYEYPYAHEVATKIERMHVESLGGDWAEYSKIVSKHLKEVAERKLQKSPKDLDLSPYIYERDQIALKEIRESMEL